MSAELKAGDCAEYRTDDGRWHACVIWELAEGGFVIVPMFGRRGYVPASAIRPEATP